MQNLCKIIVLRMYSGRNGSKHSLNFCRNAIFIYWCRPQICENDLLAIFMLRLYSVFWCRDSNI
jgi:hypothetical protein